MENADSRGFPEDTVGKGEGKTKAKGRGAKVEIVFCDAKGAE